MSASSPPATEIEIERAALGRLGPLLGHGGQAEVFDLPDLRLSDVPAQLVLKQYLQGVPVQPGLRTAVAMRATLDPQRRAELDAFAAWPVRAVVENQSVLGAVMPRIPDEFFVDVWLPGTKKWQRKPREAQYLFIDAAQSAYLRVYFATAEERLAILRAMAAAVAFVHDELHAVFGDLNARNIAFRLAPDTAVMLVDCDGVRRRGVVGGQLHAPDWEPPERGAQTTATDRYKLGLLILRALTPGPFSSVNRDPTVADGELDDTGRQMLSLAVGPDPAQRPPAAEWFRYFSARLGLAADPPVLHSVGIDRSFVVPGASVTVSWVAEHADTIEIAGSQMAAVRVNAAAGAAAVAPQSTGPLTVTARNGLGQAEQLTPPIAVLEMPHLGSLAVPVPDVQLSLPSMITLTTAPAPHPFVPPPPPEMAAALPPFSVLLPRFDQYTIAVAEPVTVPSIECPIDIVSLTTGGPDLTEQKVTE